MFRMVSILQNFQNPTRREGEGTNRAQDTSENNSYVDFCVASGIQNIPYLSMPFYLTNPAHREHDPTKHSAAIVFRILLSLVPR